MGKTFFQSWELWEKMTFVLACAIVCTIGAGWLKVWYSHWRIKKYSKLQGSRNSQEPQMVEAATGPTDEEDVPFGIRAIQSGIQVDGIWISGNNTPVPLSPASTALSKPDGQGSAPSSRPMSTLEMPQPLTGPYSSRPTSSGAGSSTFDRAVSAERLPISREASPVAGPSFNSRHHRPPPVAYSRYSQSSLGKHSATLDALEASEPYQTVEHPGTPANKNDSGSRKSSGSSNNPEDRNSSSSDDSRELQQPSLLAPRPRDPRTDLGLLHSHRLSHVAETGSLSRREKAFDRTPGRSGEWGSVVSDLPSARSPVLSDLPSPPLLDKTPSPPAVNANSDYAFLAPLEAIGSQVPPQVSPPLETYQPSGPDYAYAESSSQAQNDHHGARKVNSGFEVLPAGTFDAPAEPEEAHEQKHQPKRLQKKRRPSAESRTSNFVEQV
ncbi:uncharacterized protein K452DRAFT_264714 [Aplosporella prunicola CBS 121167]|uniref:Uncharacterized protein n=1 Tax=Aplosporella prunicola CBS 121167 TaxID=1176127 RepID=A0A6A6BQ55_9PEZI|nr:uncharacterized protein K452DRAFT_264714 [Aplosporella prunicola CBS 121167]KAF2145573.1 hypothetical protein K452DRAFT_264714 [Aplosporella prunicola CBS 121167]